MFTLNDDFSIYATRGDTVFFTVMAEENGVPYYFEAGDVLRMKIFGKKNATEVVLEKLFPVTAKTDRFTILLTEEDTKIGDVISKPKDYWYEIELNPFTNPQTIIGYDEDGAKVFRLFPEGKDSEIPEVDPEDIPVVDDELDMTSNRPVQNQAIARAIVNLEAAYRVTKEEVEEKAQATSETVANMGNELAAERKRIDNIVALKDGSTTGDAELQDIRVGADGKTYASAGTAVRSQVTNLIAYADSSFVEIGYASKYISACKVFTDEYEYLMLSDIRRNFSGETGFRIYSCDVTGKTFTFVSSVILPGDFQKGYIEHQFGNNSMLSCYLDLSAMVDGDRRTGDGLPFVLKRECISPMNLNIDVNRIKEILFTACNVKPKKILTWVDDDTPLDGIASVKRICDNLRIKCTFATITQNWTDPLLETLHQYQKEGFHVACHTENHGRWYKDMEDGSMFTAQEIETDLLTSLEKMRAEGFFDCDMLVYPGSSSGRTDVDTIGIVKKWCRCGVLAGGSTWSKYGQGKYKINRTFIAKSTNNTSYYKNLLDSVTDESWVVLGTHSGSATDFDSDMVTEILSHALANGWTIMPLNEALKYREKYYHIQEMLGL